MKIEIYHLKSDKTLTVFEFTSVGPKGSIEKLIHFQLAYKPDIFNLAFGDKNKETGEIDDLVISNNGDTEKVLTTVVSSLYLFFNKHPNALIYLRGSTTARTRLYRIGITKFFAELTKDFIISGQVGNYFYPFEIGNYYDGFLAQRKFD